MVQLQLVWLIVASVGQTTASRGSPWSRSRNPVRGDSASLSERGDSWYRRATAFDYVGCVSDGSKRALTGHSVDSGSMTVENCQATCDSKGFIYAGLENGRQCYCGNALSNGEGKAVTGCKYTCSGNSAEKCGGSYQLSLYKKSATASSSSAQPTSSSSSRAASSPASSSTARSSSSSRTSSTSSATSSTSSRAASTSSVQPSSSSQSSASSSYSNPTGATSAYGVASLPRAPGTKALYAHHIVGNTYDYSSSDWADDIGQAAAAGIDGFALNFGSSDWQFPQMRTAYSAAESQGFKMFLSIDFSANPCASTSDADFLSTQVQNYATSSAQAKYNGKVLVGTFAGEQCSFGQGSYDAGFGYFRQLLASKNVGVTFVPAIFIDPALFKGYSWMDGEFNWNSGWPMSGSPLDTSSDQQYMGALGNKTYMPAISPFFFTYYGPNSYNKNWIYRSDDWLLARRFEQVAAMRDKVDFAQLISWNDYGESHYVGPVRRVSTPWSVNLPHTNLHPLINYYASAFKTGSYPSITSDQLFLWTRPHSKNANPSSPTLSKPSNWQYTDDNLYVVVLLTQSAKVTIYSGTNKASWNAPAGLNKFSVPSLPGVVGATIERGGVVVKSYDSSGVFSYTATPPDWNFNYFVANA